MIDEIIKLTRREKIDWLTKSAVAYIGNGLWKVARVAIYSMIKIFMSDVHYDERGFSKNDSSPHNLQLKYAFCENQLLFHVKYVYIFDILIFYALTLLFDHWNN